MTEMLELYDKDLKAAMIKKNGSIGTYKIIERNEKMEIFSKEKF